MTKTYMVTAVTYLGRQDGNENGLVKQYEIYVSTDGKNWGTAAASGTFAKTTALQVAKLKTATAARYIKFVAKSEVNGNAWTCAAEIGIQASGDVTAVNSPTPPLSQGEGTAYNLQGRKASSTAKGILIQAGKKVVNK